MKGQNAADRLEKAYFALLKDTHYSKITVSDIIKKAEISRTISDFLMIILRAVREHSPFFC